MNSLLVKDTILWIPTLHPSSNQNSGFSCCLF